MAKKPFTYTASPKVTPTPTQSVTKPVEDVQTPENNSLQGTDTSAANANEDVSENSATSESSAMDGSKDNASGSDQQPVTTETSETIQGAVESAQESQGASDEQPATQEVVVNSAPINITLGTADTSSTEVSKPAAFNMGVSTPAAPKFTSGAVVQPNKANVGKEAPQAFKQAISQERTDKPVDTRSAWQHKIDAIMAGTNKRERYVVTQLEAYLSDMSPNKPVETATGVLRQKQLWRCLKNVVSNEEGFADAMRLTIDYFREHSKGSFGAIYIHRFAPDLDLSRDESRGLEQLCNVFMTAAGVVNQKDVLKHCALRTVELKGVDEIVRERLYNYFDNQ